MAEPADNTTIPASAADQEWQAAVFTKMQLLLQPTPEVDKSSVTARDVGIEALHCHDLIKAAKVVPGEAAEKQVGAEEIKRFLVTSAAAGAASADIAGQLAALETRLKNHIDERTEQITEQVTEQVTEQMTQQMKTVTETFAAISYNAAARNHNGMSAVVSHDLRALKKENAEGDEAPGAMPELAPTGVFPRTIAGIGTLTNAQLNTLATFYQTTFGGASVDERRNSFKVFIGAK